MTFDLIELAQWEQIERALHGDLEPLISLLRANEPISRIVRNYLAGELERGAAKRFRARSKADLSVRERDQWLLWAVYMAKAELVLLDNPDADEATQLDAIGRLDTISDRRALDYLSGRGSLDWFDKDGREVDETVVGNARRRAPRSPWNPGGTRKRKLVPPSM